MDEYNEKSITIRTISIIMTVMAFLITMLIYYAISDIDKGYRRMNDEMEKFMLCENYSLQLKGVSEYLTEQARDYVMTGDIVYADNYFEETEVNRNREQTIEALNSLVDNYISYSHLRLAKTNSYRLIETEYKAFMLAFKGYGVDPTLYPALDRVHLSPTEEALSDEEKIALAKEILFDEKYQKFKNDTNENIQISINELTELLETEISKEMQSMQSRLNRQRILVLIVLLLVLLMVILTWKYVVNPLTLNNRQLLNNEKLDVIGAREIRVFAHSYNAVFEKNRKANETLSYEASHDQMTGLYNRKAYDAYLEQIEGSDYCMILLDVDRFKEINDTYGHDVGDRILQKVADSMIKNFRGDDRSFRLGGDEMAIIMSNVKEDARDVIVRKAEQIKQILGTTDDELPNITASMGIAFSNSPFTTGSIYKDADLALYEAKKEHNGKYVFFSEELKKKNDEYQKAHKQ